MPQELIVERVRFEHLREALGIGTARPRLSWLVTGAPAGWRQAGYEIAAEDPDGHQVTTGRRACPESVLVDWPFPELRSRERRAVRVRLWGSVDGGEAGGEDGSEAGGQDGSEAGGEDLGGPSAWSEPAAVEAGLLDPADWRATWIVPEVPEADCDPGPALLLRRGFRLSGGIESARLYVTARGCYQMEINGVPVGDDVLAPGWTSYRHRLRYRTHDVTALLREGDNAIGAWLADGWYRGLIGFGGGVRRVYGDRLGLLAQLEVRHAGGTTTVCTDGRWRAAPGPIVSTGLYEGECYDARLEQPGWSGPGFDDCDWIPVVEDGTPGGAGPAGTGDAGPAGTGEAGPGGIGEAGPALVAPEAPAVRPIELLEPVSIGRTPSGRVLVDFGQNLTGRLRITVSGPAGARITLRHAEVLEDGELCRRPLRNAPSIDSYVLRGDAVERWEPRFTLHGFRYADVHGWPGTLDPSSIRAVVCHTDLEPAGDFECSQPLLNRLHGNVRWSMRGNFVDIATDCPQRDERLGWTGDLAIFSPTAVFLYDCAGMLSSWLRDVAIEQRVVGTVPHYVPWVPLRFAPEPAAAWGDAAVIVPWVLYRNTGDLDLLRRQYPSMTAWVDQIAGIAGASHRWERGYQWGDWLDPSAPPDRPGDARTDRYLVATAYHAYTARLLGRIAGLLGHDDDAARYTELAERVRDAFCREWVSPNGRVVSDSQTGYALALRFDLLPDPARRAWAARRLRQLVAEAEHRIGTGFVGTPLICDALVDAGAVDDAYHLLTQTGCPSWLYPVTMGATTVWERWDSLLPDGSVNPGDMTSFNHYGLGSIADFLHRVVAGLSAAEPGYRRLLVAPRPGGGLSRASASHRTPYGTARVSWQRSGGRLRVEVVVPTGATATVRLPADGWRDVEVGSGTHEFRCGYRDPADDPPPPVPAPNVHAADAGTDPSMYA